MSSWLTALIGEQHKEFRTFPTANIVVFWTVKPCRNVLHVLRLITDGHHMASPTGLHSGIYQTESEHLVPRKTENSCFLVTWLDMAISISQCLKHCSAQNIADYLASSVGSIPHCHATSLENIPPMTSVQNIPHCLTTNLENIPHCTSLENLPLCLATDMLWTFSCALPNSAKRGIGTLCSDEPKTWFLQFRGPWI